MPPLRNEITMFRFAIRDVLWLTAIVALSLGWGLEHWHVSTANRWLSRDREIWKTRAINLKAMLKALDGEGSQDVEWTNHGKAGFKMRQIERPILTDEERALILSDTHSP